MNGKDVVWVPTEPEVVAAMLDLAEVTPKDFVMDLGSGDGRNIIAAAKRGAHGLGVEFNPDMVALSRRIAQQEGVADRAQFVEGDMYEADMSRATVLALFLLPHNLERLKDKILALPPGTRMVLNTYRLDGWDAVSSTTVHGDCTTWCEVTLHLVPAPVEGSWQLDGVPLVLEQRYEKVSGKLGPNREASVAGHVRASDIELFINGQPYKGRVEGDRITGTVPEPGGRPRAWTAVRTDR